MKNKSKHDPDDLGPLDPRQLEKWADRYETIRLLRHLISFTRSEQGNMDPFGFTVDRFHRAKALLVHLLRRRRRDD